jgi:F-type H+-transporting ATPase subunit alpha
MAATLYAANKGFLDNIEVNQVLHFEAGLHHYLKDKCADLLAKLEKDKAMDKDAEADLVKAIEAFKKSFV